MLLIYIVFSVILRLADLLWWAKKTLWGARGSVFESHRSDQ